MLIKMLDVCCGVISGIKRKYVNSVDRVNYYDLNNDYEEHLKIIQNASYVEESDEES